MFLSLLFRLSFKICFVCGPSFFLTLSLSFFLKSFFLGMISWLKEALKGSEIIPGHQLSVENGSAVWRPRHMKNVPFLTWTLTGSIQCSRVSAVMFSGRITGSLGGIIHDGEHTAPEGTEIYSVHLASQISVFFILESIALIFQERFLCYRSRLLWSSPGLISMYHVPDSFYMNS